MTVYDNEMAVHANDTTLYGNDFIVHDTEMQVHANIVVLFQAFEIVLQ